MLDLAVRNTKKLIRETSKNENIRIGRFFTKREIARSLAGSFTFVSRYSVRLLDAGAGTGILAAAAVEAIAKSGGVTEIYLTCYENDPAYLPRLTDNLERVRKKARHDYHVKLRVTVLAEDFLTATHADDERYDYIITNPPQETAEGTYATLFPEVFPAGAPLACLFTWVAASLLAPDGQLITTMPLKTVSAVSLIPFRRALFRVAAPERVFLYAREKETSPLRPVVTLKLKEGSAPEEVRLLIFPGEDTPATDDLPPLPYDAVVSSEDASLCLVHSGEELAALVRMRDLPCRFSTFGLRVRTGLVLESRYPELLRDAPVDGAVPLLHPRCLKDGMVQFPLPGVRHQYIIPRTAALSQPGKNILLMKRVPAKSDKRRLTCAVLLKNTVPAHFSTSNKLNYIDAEGDEQMDPGFLFGLFGFLSSAPVDAYIRLTSKSGQLNAKELARLPLPDAEHLRQIGGRLMAMRSYKPDYCDKVVHEILGIG